MMGRKFSKCPSWWVRQGALQAFSSSKGAGQNIAALKCLLAISLGIDFWSRKVRLSLSDLEKATGLSRPMVIRGLKVLEGLEIVSVGKESHVHEYELTVREGDDKWAKVPFDRMKKQLPTLPNRGAIPLTALKIYLLLIAIRPNESATIPIRYDLIEEYLKCRRAHIRPALDILYSHMLVGIALEGEEKRRRHNVYEVLGF